MRKILVSLIFSYIVRKYLRALDDKLTSQAKSKAFTRCKTCRKSINNIYTSQSVCPHCKSKIEIRKYNDNSK